MNRHAKTWVGRWVAPVAIGSALLAGCSTQTEQPSPSTTPPSATATTPTMQTTPSGEDPALAPALDAYQRYWAAQARSQAHPSEPQDVGLAQNARGQALAGAQSTLLLFRQNGIATTGQPILHPVASVRAGRSDVVDISDCVDSSGWKPIYVATGKSALAPGQSPRTVIESSVVLVGGHWLVATSTAQRDRSC